MPDAMPCTFGLRSCRASQSPAAGVWGRNHVRNYAELGALAAALVDQRPRRRRANMAERSTASRAHGRSRRSWPIRRIDGRRVLALPPVPAIMAIGDAGARGRQAPVRREADGARRSPGRKGCCSGSRGPSHDRRADGRPHPAIPPGLPGARSTSLRSEGRLGDAAIDRLDAARFRPHSARRRRALGVGAARRFDDPRARRRREPERIAGGRAATIPIRLDRRHDDRWRSRASANRVRAEIRVSWLSPLQGAAARRRRGSDGMAVFDDREPWERKLVLHPYGLRERPSGDPT